jgi:molybdopterin-guanine dinucleotide biosynthesis protein B
VADSSARDRPRVYRFIGHSGSGKTTLLERVIAELVDRGLRVAVVKDTHHSVELDEPGKDSFRLRAAGAAQVILSMDHLLAMLEPRSERAGLAEIAELVVGRCDVLLAEGYRHDPDYPAVVVWRAALGRGLPSVEGSVIAAVAEGAPEVEVPTFGFDRVVALVDLLLGTSPRGTDVPLSSRAQRGI